MKRYYYSNSIELFLLEDPNTVLGHLSRNSEFNDELNQKEAWYQEIIILKRELISLSGQLFFEFSIPRMGRRIDAVIIIENIVFPLEFKIGQSVYLPSNIDQVWDYALDLKYFHKPSENILIAPILIASAAPSHYFDILPSKQNDNVLYPLKVSETKLKEALITVLTEYKDAPIDARLWSEGMYSPSPTIIEAAISLFNNHSVADISRSDATADELAITNNNLLNIIKQAKENNEKAICFLTGVPGSGKTLVGLDIATNQLKEQQSGNSVFLSGNGPLVAILREALTRDKFQREKEAGRKIKKGEILRSVKTFVQNIHHFRDEGLIDKENPPVDHVAIFDEAQRAWNLTQTKNFMSRKKKIQDFEFSEPEFLISYLDRHQDWAVIICLVGGGQEINTGEAGISEWLNSICGSFPHWKVYVSEKLTDTEYAAGNAIALLNKNKQVHFKRNLHLSVTMRSFRAENLSHLVKNLLDLKPIEAKFHYDLLKENYPLVITRDLQNAKNWLKSMARGSERFGIVVSSKAERLKPHAIDVKSPMNPVHWFLNGKEDVRSSYYLEHVATEFDVQGLELDWVCVTWDGDFRYANESWKSFEFNGNKWQKIHKEERKLYLKNAYRVLLTRARQGMVIVVPYGDEKDPTRAPEFYDSTYAYLSEIGFRTI